MTVSTACANIDLISSGDGSGAVLEQEGKTVGKAGETELKAGMIVRPFQFGKREKSPLQTPLDDGLKGPRFYVKYLFCTINETLEERWNKKGQII